MSVITIVGVSLLALVVGFFGLQVVMVKRMQRQRGKPAPELDGKAGKLVKKGRDTLFYFYSPQCGACRAMTPVVQTLSRNSEGVFPVDISRDMATARKFGVMATPTTIVVKRGLIDQVLVGPQPESLLRQLVA